LLVYPRLRLLTVGPNLLLRHHLLLAICAKLLLLLLRLSLLHVLLMVWAKLLLLSDSGLRLLGVRAALLRGGCMLPASGLPVDLCLVLVFVAVVTRCSSRWSRDRQSGDTRGKKQPSHDLISSEDT